jgi:hypothetical protein
METTSERLPGRGMFIGGWVLTGLVTAFLLFDGLGKVLVLEPVRKATEEMGMKTDILPGIGMLLIASTILYAIPRTAVLGAVLLTGYMGGAIATHVLLEGWRFPIAFATTFGLLIWLGICLREPRLWLLLPIRR